MGSECNDKVSLRIRWNSWISMVYELQVQVVQEVQGEQGADSAGRAGVLDRNWAEAPDFVRMARARARSRERKPDW